GLRVRAARTGAEWRLREAIQGERCGVEVLPGSGSLVSPDRELVGGERQAGRDSPEASRHVDPGFGSGAAARAVETHAAIEVAGVSSGRAQGRSATPVRRYRMVGNVVRWAPRASGRAFTPTLRPGRRNRERNSAIPSTRNRHP